MQKALVHFKGLYGDNPHSLLPNFIHYEALETRSKMYDWEIKEHLHTDLFQPDVNGEVLTFSESFLESLLKPTPKTLHEINHLRVLSLEQDSETFERLMLYKTHIIKELYEDFPEKQVILQSLFQLFFTHLYRFTLRLSSASTSSDNRTLRYFQLFRKSLQESKSIHEYAKELNITAVHLNRVCQAIVQKSALQIVHEHLINEAKKYLLNTNYSISEVSYFLNFKDPAYFTRLFKKMTGVTPSEFRKN
jgi:AraC family transcriptional regulator, transcriptional activator of pobA